MLRDLGSFQIHISTFQHSAFHISLRTWLSMKSFSIKWPKRHNVSTVGVKKDGTRVKHCKNFKTTLIEVRRVEIVFIVNCYLYYLYCLYCLYCLSRQTYRFPNRSKNSFMYYSYPKFWRVVLVVPLPEMRRECCQPSDGIYTRHLDICTTFE